MDAQRAQALVARVREGDPPVQVAARAPVRVVAHRQAVKDTPRDLQRTALVGMPMIGHGTREVLRGGRLVVAASQAEKALAARRVLSELSLQRNRNARADQSPLSRRGGGRLLERALFILMPLAVRWLTRKIPT